MAPGLTGYQATLDFGLALHQSPTPKAPTKSLSRTSALHLRPHHDLAQNSVFRGTVSPVVPDCHALTVRRISAGILMDA